ncbi:hypothetical protein COT48_00900 [Candidatus Woesearchaeota archaeon CG08_land_8_20_14_0_20_47_9]|nr:MAG: hypothetical protein AUJ69_04380 [Candidatus Woesearchaeota archaeon CG1_02_47_18]PIO04347.1 MAG: hypothetical protein COT48_00900 [Candidatus Woesearchaeota archaeon CG08_land_8_20_14_0_20_47_9]HII29455.1 hypothetical protein [Candidatus Woesearchaeota archaeon]
MKSGNITLTKSMICTLIAIINGKNSLGLLQQELNASKSWVTRIIEQLEKQGFARKIRRGISLKIELAETPFAISFRNMYLEKPYRKYEEMFLGRNLDVLLSIATGKKSAQTIADMMGVQARIIRPRLRFLANKGLLVKEGRKYGISESQKQVIRFLLDLRNFSTYSGRLLWRFGDESLIKVRSPPKIKGALTGMNRYKDFGVAVNTVAFMCYMGHEKISINHVFLHSLFEIDDARSVSLAVTFYAKNKLYTTKNLRKIHKLAEKYDKSNEVKEIERIFILFKQRKTEKIIESEWLPVIDLKEIKRHFALYEVKNV